MAVRRLFTTLREGAAVNPAHPAKTPRESGESEGGRSLTLGNIHEKEVQGRINWTTRVRAMVVAPDAPTIASPGLEMAEVPEAPTFEMSPGLEMAEVPEAPTFASPGQEVVAIPEVSPFARSPGPDFLQVPEAVTPIPMTPELEFSEATTVALATELDPCENQLVQSVLVACQPYIMKVVTLQATVADQAEELDALRREVAPHDEEIKELRKELAELKEEITSLRNSRQGGSGRQSPLARQDRSSPVPQLKRVGPGPGPRRVVSPDRGLSQTMQRVRKL